MSRIGNIPIVIPDGIDVKINGSHVKVSKGNQSLEHTMNPGIEAKLEGGELLITSDSSTRQIRALHGLNRSLINNMVVGLNEGFSKKLQINGVGFRAAMQGNTLVLNIGYSHPIEMAAPEGITIEVPTTTEINVTGADKQLVGETAAKIRGFRVPDPYKGKGIKYEDEILRLREGKTGAGA